MNFLKRRSFLLFLFFTTIVIIFFIQQNETETITNNVKNYGTFKYKLFPNCQNTNIIWLVTSYAGNSNRRNAHRTAYPNKELQNLGIQRIFLLGRFSKENIFNQHDVNLESSIYHDIVQGDFLEAYKMLTYKHLMGLNWISHNCEIDSYVIKMDDDIVINIYDLLPKLVRKKHFVMGYALRKMVPMRDPKNKWFITKSEFAQDFFPDFVSGWMYITNVKTARMLVNLSQKYKQFFWIDDVFVTGILRQKLNIEIIDIHEIFATDYRFLECCIKGMTKHLKCEYLVGPDGAQNDLLGHFQKYAKFCNENSCKLKAVGKTCVVVYRERRFKSPGRASVQILKT